MFKQLAAWLIIGSLAASHPGIVFADGEISVAPVVTPDGAGPVESSVISLQDAEKPALAVTDVARLAAIFAAVDSQMSQEISVAVPDRPAPTPEHFQDVDGNITREIRYPDGTIAWETTYVNGGIERGIRLSNGFSYWRDDTFELSGWGMDLFGWGRIDQMTCALDDSVVTTITLPDGTMIRERRDVFGTTREVRYPDGRTVPLPD